MDISIARSAVNKALFDSFALCYQVRPTHQLVPFHFVARLQLLTCTYLGQTRSVNHVIKIAIIHFGQQVTHLHVQFTPTFHFISLPLL